MQKGIYVGYHYSVTKKKGKTYVVLQPKDASYLSGLGADLTLLDEIGEQEPDDAMAAMLFSTPEEEDGEE